MSRPVKCIGCIWLSDNNICIKPAMMRDHNGNYQLVDCQKDKKG
jgi:hypothetical protein